MKDLIDAKHSDVYDVLAYFAYAVRHTPERSVLSGRSLL